MDPSIHDQRDPLDRIVGRCMICGTSSSRGRALSFYNKSTTVCPSCRSVEGALLIQEPKALESPKILWNEWKDKVRNTSNLISRFAGKTYIRKGIVCYPIPSREDVISWIKWTKDRQNSQSGMIHK